MPDVFLHIEYRNNIGRTTLLMMGPDLPFIYFMSLHHFFYNRTFVTTINTLFIL